MFTNLKEKAIDKIIDFLSPSKNGKTFTEAVQDCAVAFDKFKIVMPVLKPRKKSS